MDDQPTLVDEQPRPFGAELRRWRLGAGLSLAQFSKLVHYSKSYLSKIETGGKPAGADLAQRCDQALGAGGQLCALISRREPTPPRSRPESEGDGEVWMMSFAPDGSGGLLPVNRRDVLAFGAASVVGAAMLGAPAFGGPPAGRAAAAGSGVDSAPLAGWLPGAPGTGLGLTGRGMAAAAGQDGTEDAFRVLYDQSRRLGQMFSPSTVLPTVIALTQTVRGLAASAAGADRARLLLLAGRFAEYVGWMAQETGDDRAALWWTDRAVEFGGGTDGSDLTSYALVRRAEIMLYRHDAAHTVDLASLAQRDTRAPARVRGLAAQREAQGHALAGDGAQCRRALDRAEVLLASASPAGSTDPVLGSSTVPNLDEVIAGWCLHDLGRPADAAGALDRAMVSVSPSGRRAWARFEVRRALAHASAGEIEHACELTDRVLPAVDLVDSATIRVDLRKVAHTLGRWHNHPAVRDLSPRLTATLTTAGH